MVSMSDRKFVVESGRGGAQGGGGVKIRNGETLMWSVTVEVQVVFVLRL